jgi:CRISPR-associated protein Cpf1
MQIRNSDDQKNDFILSPVLSSVIAVGTNWRELIHFDSREWYKKTKKVINWKEVFETENQEPFPTSWDANGAFNIARKGLMMLNKIRLRADTDKINLFISDEERDFYLDNQ